MKITFLGTGTSHGVPQIDCLLNNYEKCPHDFCSSSDTDPKNLRTRSSILIEKDNFHVLIDTSLDFRFQMLRSKVRKIDAVLYTHSHADHIYGLPDIRSYSFNQQKGIDIYGTLETITDIKKAFGFIFTPPELKGGGIAEVNPHIISGPFMLGNMTVTAVPVHHGLLIGCVGYRINDIAYLPDVKEIPDSSIALLKGLEVLIIDSLRTNPHPTHLSMGESLGIAEELKPKYTFFTHMCHVIDYKKEEMNLPENIRFADVTLEIDI